MYIYIYLYIYSHKVQSAKTSGDLLVVAVTSADSEFRGQRCALVHVLIMKPYDLVVETPLQSVWTIMLF